MKSIMAENRVGVQEMYDRFSIGTVVGRKK